MQSNITWRALEVHSKRNRRELGRHFGIQKAFEKHLGTQGTEALEYLKSTWEIETLRHSSIWRARWYLETEALKALYLAVSSFSCQQIIWKFRNNLVFQKLFLIKWNSQDICKNTPSYIISYEQLFFWKFQVVRSFR